MVAALAGGNPVFDDAVAEFSVTDEGVFFWIGGGAQRLDPGGGGGGGETGEEVAASFQGKGWRQRGGALAFGQSGVLEGKTIAAVGSGRADVAWRWELGRGPPSRQGARRARAARSRGARW